MQLNEAIKLRINFYLNKNGISSLWQLYKLSGVPKSTINALLGSNHHKKTDIPKIPTLLHLCEGLGTNLKDFFNDPMFEDIDDDDN